MLWFQQKIVVTSTSRPTTRHRRCKAAHASCSCRSLCVQVQHMSRSYLVVRWQTSRRPPLQVPCWHEGVSLLSRGSCADCAITATRRDEDHSWQAIARGVRSACCVSTWTMTSQVLQSSLTFFFNKHIFTFFVQIIWYTKSLKLKFKNNWLFLVCYFVVPMMK